MTTSRKEFECPSCGGKSWLDPVSFHVEHSEPHCEDWKAIQSRAASVPPPASEGATVTHLAPSMVTFNCPDCGQTAILRPREKPMQVQHSLPVCKLWEKIEAKKDDVERYLIKAGVHIYAPQHELAPRGDVGQTSAEGDDAGGKK